MERLRVDKFICIKTIKNLSCRWLAEVAHINQSTRLKYCACILEKTFFYNWCKFNFHFFSPFFILYKYYIIKIRESQNFDFLLFPYRRKINIFKNKIVLRLTIFTHKSCKQRQTIFIGLEHIKPLICRVKH